MKRLLFTLLAFLSFLLCVAAVGLWVQSHRGAGSARWVAGGRETTTFARRYCEVQWESGRLRLHAGREAWADAARAAPAASTPEAPGFSLRPSSYTRFSSPRADRGAAGFGFGRSVVNYPGSYTHAGWVFSLPIWAIAVGTAAVPAAWFWRRWRRGTARGLCHVCGYDLRATPGRCPECGTSPSPTGRAPRSVFPPAYPQADGALASSDGDAPRNVEARPPS